jgi:hypothetical protein
VAKVKNFMGNALGLLMTAKKDGAGANVEEDEISPGILPSTDPFFSFVTASGGINNYMYPSLPMQAIRTIRQRDLKYSFHDILSREPSFDPLGDDVYECKGHQVTDLSEDAHTRVRKVISDVEFVDDAGLIMGDLWYPGASGYRFIYEVSTDAPGRYLALGTVPCAQLLFIYAAPKEDDDEHLVEKASQESAENQQVDTEGDEGTDVPGGRLRGEPDGAGIEHGRPAREASASPREGKAERRHALPIPMTALI